MAWITKPSGTMKIPRRNEPYLTDEMKTYLEREYLPRYETRHGALIPVLHHVQHHWGWLPWQALEEVGAFLGLAPADVWDTASFYEEFWLQPKGHTVIAVCRSIACEVCDHKAVTDACKRKLNLEVGETTPDDKFTLIELECLGACGEAPAVLVDETLHGPVTPAMMERIIDDAAKGGGHGAHGHT